MPRLGINDRDTVGSTGWLQGGGLQRDAVGNAPDPARASGNGLGTLSLTLRIHESAQLDDPGEGVNANIGKLVGWLLFERLFYFARNVFVVEGSSFAACVFRG